LEVIQHRGVRARFRCVSGQDGDALIEIACDNGRQVAQEPLVAASSRRGQRIVYSGVSSHLEPVLAHPHIDAQCHFSISVVDQEPDTDRGARRNRMANSTGRSPVNRLMREKEPIPEVAKRSARFIQRSKQRRSAKRTLIHGVHATSAIEAAGQWLKPSCRHYGGLGDVVRTLARATRMKC
jgi:hypothetical protein